MVAQYRKRAKLVVDIGEATSMLHRHSYARAIHLAYELQMAPTAFTICPRISQATIQRLSQGRKGLSYHKLQFRIRLHPRVHGSQVLPLGHRRRYRKARLHLQRIMLTSVSTGAYA